LAQAFWRRWVVVFNLVPGIEFSKYGRPSPFANWDNDFAMIWDLVDLVIEELFFQVEGAFCIPVKVYQC
jgi:hypothetical protein